MDIPLSGSTATGRNAAGHNSGHDRGLSFSNGSEARSRGPATANQQRPALARSRNLPRSNRPIHKRRDRARRACPYNQGNRAQPYQQTHFTQVGKMSAQGRKTLSGSGLAPQVAGRTENQGPPARAHVPIVREGHALGACSFRAKPDRSGRTQRSQQTAQSTADSDGARVRGPAQSTASTLPIDGSSRRLYRIANQRGSGTALAVDRLRALSDGSHRRVGSEPNNKAEIRILTGRTASGPGRCDRPSGVEAPLSGDVRELGIPQSKDQQALRFKLFAQEGAEASRATGKDSECDWLAFAASQLSSLARRHWGSTWRSAEADAPRQHFNYDECVRRCVHGRKEKSQHIRRAAGSLPRTAQIAKGRVRAALAGNYFRLMDHFGLQPEIQNSRKPMISLVAGGGFEPPTFGL